MHPDAINAVAKGVHGVHVKFSDKTSGNFHVYEAIRVDRVYHEENDSIEELILCRYFSGGLAGWFKANDLVALERVYDYPDPLLPEGMVS